MFHAKNFFKYLTKNMSPCLKIHKLHNNHRDCFFFWLKIEVGFVFIGNFQSNSLLGDPRDLKNQSFRIATVDNGPNHVIKSSHPEV